MWDAETNEYEGNLFHDPNIADTRSPSLHNHGGRRINHAVLSQDERYMMCGSQDHTASLWDLEQEVLLVTYDWHKDEVCTTLSQKGSHLDIALKVEKVAIQS